MPVTFLLILLAVVLAILAPVLALAGMILHFFTRHRMLGAHALALGSVCGLKLMLGWLLLASIVAGPESIPWSTAAVCFGAGFTTGFCLMLVWHFAHRARPNNSFKPRPLRGSA